MDLRHPGHPLGAQMTTGSADCLSWHVVVPGPQHRVGDDNGNCDIDLVSWRKAGVSRLVHSEAVEVSNALKARIMLGEQLEHSPPECLGDADLDGHPAPTWVDGPRYAELMSAVWMRLSVASTRSMPGRHF